MLKKNLRYFEFISKIHRLQYCVFRVILSVIHELLYLILLFQAQSLKVSSFPLSPNLSSSKVSSTVVSMGLCYCATFACLCCESGLVFVHLLCLSITL